MEPRSYYLIAESYDSVKDNVLPVLLPIIVKLSPRYNIVVSKNELTLNNGSVLMLRSGNEPDCLRGFCVYGAVISGWICKNAWVSAMTCLTRTQGWAVRIYE